MKAVNTELTKFMSVEAQYYVPIYQRKYSWEKNNCIKLFNDVIDVANDATRPCHFIGSVIYLAKDIAQHASAVKEYLIIDGQQRLTTISLMLLALGDYTKEYINDEITCNKASTNVSKLLRKYILNEDETGDLLYKIRLNKEDFEDYKNLINNRIKPKNRGYSRIFENYNYLLNEMRNKKIDPQLIFDGIKKLVLVDISLIAEDNAQLVFETVNSTGLPLTTADKIRNFLLMSVGASKQEELYKDYWHPMEVSLGMDNNFSGKFEYFFYNYMTTMLESNPLGNHYDVFKKYYFSNGSLNAEAIVKQISDYSEYYLRWMTANEKGNRIDKLLYKVRITNQLKITPVILKILSDLNKGDLSEDDASSILTIIESYWMRRALCSLPPNSAGPVCLSMLKSLKSSDKLNAFKNNIYKLTWAQRMPSDKEVIETLQMSPIYSISAIRTKIILDKLENNKRKEYVPTSEYTIEHIMPQTLSDQWKEDLGEQADRIHEVYLHTLGNLTLTGYNSEYQNKTFAEKQECIDRNGDKIGYKHTPIKISHDLANEQNWGEAQIISRSNRLAKELLKIWQYPQ